MLRSFPMVICPEPLDKLCNELVCRQYIRSKTFTVGNRKFLIVFLHTRYLITNVECTLPYY